MWRLDDLKRNLGRNDRHLSVSGLGCWQQCPHCALAAAEDERRKMQELVAEGSSAVNSPSALAVAEDEIRRLDCLIAEAGDDARCCRACERRRGDGTGTLEVDEIEDETTDAERAAARERFWSTQPDHLWVVPMARDNNVMPWLRGRECGMLEAIARAHANGKTPLLVDNTEHRVVDTFYMCKRMLRRVTLPCHPRPPAYHSPDAHRLIPPSY